MFSPNRYSLRPKKKILESLRHLWILGRHLSRDLSLISRSKALICPNYKKATLSIGIKPSPTKEFGYLIAGFVLQALGFKGGETLEKIADLGVTLLLFSIGLKLRLRNLENPISGPGHQFTW